MEEKTSIDETDKELDNEINRLSIDSTANNHINILMDKKDFSLFELYRKYKNGQLVLDPAFQRNDVWKHAQKCELIESILIGLPIPIFYFQITKDLKYIVIDGRQRLSAIFTFFDEKFSLTNLKILKQLNSKKMSDLKDSYGIYKHVLEDYQVYCHIIKPPTSDSIIFEIFERVNRAGTQLNKQEIINAIHQGPALDMIKSIAASEVFQKASRISLEADTRMKGCYVLTRFMAYYCLLEEDHFSKEKYHFTGDLNKLIEDTLRWLNQRDKEYLNNIKILIENSIEKVYKCLNKGAFRRDANVNKPLNMRFFETEVYFFMFVDDKTFMDLYSRVFHKLKSVISDELYIKYIEGYTNNLECLYGRFSMMKQAAKELYDD